MGQNHEKMDAGEHVLAEGEADAGSRPRGEREAHTGDVIEGRSSHEREEEEQEEQEEEEEAGSTRLDSRGSDTVNEEPSAPSSQDKLWVRPSSASEVRSEGKRKEVLEGGAAGGQANQLGPQSGPRLEETDAAFKSRHQSTREEKSFEEQPRRRLRSRMKEVTLEQEVSEDGAVLRKREAENSAADTAEELVRRRRYGASSAQAAHRGADMVAGRDSSPLAGTLGLFTDRKEPPPTETPHPSKNSLQKESQSELKDRAPSGAPSQRNLHLTEEETLKLLLNDCSPTRLEAVTLRLHMEAAGGTTDSELGSGPLLPRPSSSGALGSETTGSESSHSGLSAPSEPSSILEKLLQRNKKHTGVANMEIQDVDLNQLCNGAEPEVPPSRTDLSITLNRVPSGNYGRSSEEESHGPSTTPDLKVSHAKGERQIANPLNLHSSPAGGSPPLLPGSGTRSTHSEDQGRSPTPKEHQRVVDQVEQDPASTRRVEDPLSTQREDLEPPATRANQESSDSVRMRDQSHHNRPKSRPVSQLIKETIQLHEKLQQHERARPAAESRSEEQNQSVKVAQMKAAFDTAQRPPEKSVERKPSVRRGKTGLFLHFLSGHDTATQATSQWWR